MTDSNETWHSWFAWKPVRVQPIEVEHNKFVNVSGRKWLRRLERRNRSAPYGWWEYRLRADAPEVAYWKKRFSHG